MYDIVEALGPGAQQKGLTLKVHVEPAVSVTARCDGNRLRQILVNLIGNAIKFTATGAVTVDAICAGSEGQQMRVRFAVSDTGIGIPDDRVDRLFSPFTQVDSSTTRQFGGSGLGLAICKQLVELMHGEIGIDSQVSRGSTFWFEVPLHVSQSAAESATSGRRINGTRILVVAGDEQDRSQILDCLRGWGCHAELASNYCDAIVSANCARADGNSWDVVLVELPVEAAARRELIQTLAQNHGLPVIGFGATPDEQEMKLLEQFGLRRLLRDPVRPSSLLDALTSTLSVRSSSPKSPPPGGSAFQSEALVLTGHVLVAEDNHINQMYVTELLKHCGCTCDIAGNGDEALQAIQRGPYDLMLMDCQMPEMDGFTAAREIRRRESASPLTGHLPIIALTANALRGDRENCLEAGMDDYLCKPLQAAELRTMLAKYLPSDLCLTKSLTTARLVCESQTATGA